MSEVHVETLLGAGYALFLVLAALALELLARHSHVRSERYRTAGFAYHDRIDAWVCPEGEHLHLRETDHERRLARYRARARVCNACPRKQRCTDSDDGREVVRAMDPWPHSEAGRFHRGVCLVLIALAGLVLLVDAVRHHDPAEVAALAFVAAIVAAAAQHMLSAFRTTPANFPPSPAHPASAPGIPGSRS